MHDFSELLRTDSTNTADVNRFRCLLAKQFSLEFYQQVSPLDLHFFRNLKDKIMAHKLMYIPYNDKEKYPFCR